MDSLRKTLPLYTAPCSVIANSFLIYLILCKSPAQMGNYKHLLIGVSVFEIAYGLLDIVTETTVLSIGPSFVVIIPHKDRFFGKDVAMFFNCLYCGFFGFSMRMFVIIFAYRLFVATESQILKYFEGSKILLWFGYPLSHLIIFTTVAYGPFSPFPEMDKFVSTDIQETLNMSLDDVTYTGPLFYSPLTNEVRMTTMVVSLLQYIFTTSSLLLVIIFGFKCYFCVMKIVQIQDSLSLKLRNLQKQLFVALVFQALVPLILMHIPVTILYTCSLLSLNFNPFSVSTTIALFPALDPFPTIFIVKTYRMTVMGYFNWIFRCRHPKPKEVSVKMESRGL